MSLPKTACTCLSLGVSLLECISMQLPGNDPPPPPPPHTHTHSDPALSPAPVPAIAISTPGGSCNHTSTGRRPFDSNVRCLDIPCMLSDSTEPILPVCLARERALGATANLLHKESDITAFIYVVLGCKEQFCYGLAYECLCGACKLLPIESAQRHLLTPWEAYLWRMTVSD